MQFLVVFFDVGGTLLNETDFPAWVALGRELGLDLDESHLAHAYHAIESERDTPTPPPKAGFWPAVLERATEGPVDPELAARFRERAEGLPPHPPLYSDVRRCLVQLREDGRRLGVISNSRSQASISGLLEHAGILSFFDPVISSGTEGFAKPDPRLFHRALERAGVPKESAFYVGNLAQKDARAAQAAGIASVWLNREGTGFGEDPPEITSLTELPFHLYALEGRPEPEPLGRRPARG